MDQQIEYIKSRTIVQIMRLVYVRHWSGILCLISLIWALLGIRTPPGWKISSNYQETRLLYNYQYTTVPARRLTDVWCSLSDDCQTIARCLSDVWCIYGTCLTDVWRGIWQAPDNCLTIIWQGAPDICQVSGGNGGVGHNIMGMWAFGFTIENGLCWVSQPKTWAIHLLGILSGNLSIIATISDPTDLKRHYFKGHPGGSMELIFTELINLSLRIQG